MNDVAEKAAARTIAIGDVHGCAAALEALLNVVAPQADDVIVTLGDYVDRGDDSRGVIQQLIDVSENCHLIALLGNHEEMMLSSLKGVHDDSRVDDVQFWLQCGGRETIESYGDVADVPQSHIDFLNSCQSHYETDSHIFVHANYDARLPMDEQSVYMLRWCHLHQIPPDQHVTGKTVIVGHTPQASGEILNLGHVIGIDTYCVGGKWLSALDVLSGQIWQADMHGSLRR